jgi:cytochrome b561
MSSAAARYSRSLVVLHWLTMLLVIGAWLTAEGARGVARNPPLLHFTMGFAVLMLVLPRLVLRLLGQAPAPAAGPLAGAARLGHGVLYLLLIAAPLTGWLAAARMGVAVEVFGLPLPVLLDRVAGKPGRIGDLHENGGDLIMILAGLHGLMALWHQFVLRDGTLARMWPGRTAPRRR